MTKALRKNTRRSISGSLGRYIAILLIIMLGVAFLTGLRDTRPIMSATETAAAMPDNWVCPVCKMPKKAFVRRN